MVQGRKHGLTGWLCKSLGDGGGGPPLGVGNLLGGGGGGGGEEGVLGK